MPSRGAQRPRHDVLGGCRARATRWHLVRGAKAVDADGHVGHVPSRGLRRPDRHGRHAGRQHVGPVGLRLGRQGPTTASTRRVSRRPARRGRGGLEAHGHLAPSADQHEPGWFDVTDHGGAHLHGRAVGHTGTPCRQDQCGGPGVLDGDAPRLRVSLASAGPITWSPGMARIEASARSAGAWVLLAEPDGVVGEHEDVLGLGERRQPERGSEVAAEDEERAADRRVPPCMAIRS